MMYLAAIRAQIRNLTSKFIKNESGVTAIEYAIVAAGVSAVILTIFRANGGPVSIMLEDVFNNLKYKMESIIYS
ncbi:Flp family type IVb pilin [Gilliamella apicola]|uniref:Flp family type IVb pilin n=1 Tax=Gilliamella apicola TaxID=1196095 RepID=UPI002FEE5E6A|nr:Flp family type IVb pilin [Gilliamella apicola]